MNIVYQDKDLKKCSENAAYALRRLGAMQAKCLFQRIVSIKNAESFEDLRHLPGHFHELRHNRKGQWSFSLNGPYRLIVTPLEHPIPLTSHGQFDWQAIRGAVIIEIVNYHHEGD